jgi:cytochrome P450 family 110
MSTTHEGGDVGKTPAKKAIPKIHFSILAAIRAITDPQRVVTDAMRDVGETLEVNGPAGQMIMSGDPEIVRAIFTADHDQFGIPFRPQLGPFFGETSLIMTPGARHKKDRRLLAPPFHGARMRAYGKTIVDIALRHAAKLVRGKTFRMLELTQAITLDVILEAIFGVDDDAFRDRFRAAIIDLVESMNSPIITVFEVTRKEFGGFGPWARFRRCAEALDALIYAEIKNRRGKTAGREDIFSLLLDARYDDGEGMTEKELRDQLHLLFFAGHDTTSTALAWAFYFTCRQPIEKKKLLDEIDKLGDSPEPEAIVALPYLDAFCQETLRIHPVAPNVARQLEHPFELAGQTIPAGTTLAASIMMLHQNEKLYPEPNKFRPERFLDRKFSPYEFIPFGGGPRRCIGAAFAMYELKIALATLLRRYEFRLVKDAPVKYVQRGLTMGPKGGIEMVVEAKRQHP